jgi:hypothetical protein
VCALYARTAIVAARCDIAIGIASGAVKMGFGSRTGRGPEMTRA